MYNKYLGYDNFMLMPALKFRWLSISGMVLYPLGIERALILRLQAYLFEN